MKTTRAQHLELKIARLERDVREAQTLLGQARRSLAATRDTAPYPSGPQTCSGCGTPLHSEYEFWDHFHVPNPMYLNLGNCPKAPR